MKGLLAWWERLCTSSKILRFVDINLRGIGQVMFQNNPVTGLAFLAAVGWGSYVAGVPQVAIGGLLEVVAATLTAQWLHVDEAGLASDLYGYNASIDPAAANPLNVADFVQGVLNSISQVFLKGNGLSALLLLAGLAVSSLAAAVFALLSAIVAVVTAHLLGAESELITGGLLGFSPVLTAVALGTVFYRPGARVVVYTLLGTVFTVIVQGAMNVALTPFAIPTLTAPFVLASWLFLLPRQHFE
ncbi:MAG: urea transporter [Burkholderiales bacterium]